MSLESNPLRVNLSREEIRQIKIKAAQADRPMSRFIADHLRETLNLEKPNDKSND